MSEVTKSQRKRVVITGAGVMTSMGCGWAENVEGFREGRLALSEVSLFDTTRQRTGRAGQVTLPKTIPMGHLTPRQQRRVDRATALVLVAAHEAWSQAGWMAEELVSEAIPIVLGTSAGAMALGEAYYRQATESPAHHKGQAERVHHYQVQVQAGMLADSLGISGPITMISNACASGANAIGHAMKLIASGRAERAVCGGYDALSHLVFAGFDSLQALSTTLPRPFDAQRDGLAIGEGAGIFLLESLDSAQARGATILAEITGYGAATDVHHLTQPQPDGLAALASMSKACAMAGLEPAQIGYINSHGTGTPLNDVAEAQAIAKWAGHDAATIAVSSTKGSIGHLLGGAGAVEAVICLMVLREDFLPPQTTIGDADPAVTFDLVRSPRSCRLNHVLTNSFGFGGANATLILSRWKG